jgi:hypothetical protein
VAGFTFGRRTEDGGNIVVAFDVGLLGEIEIPAIGLALTRKSGFQIVFGLGSLEVRHAASPALIGPSADPPAGFRTRLAHRQGV